MSHEMSKCKITVIKRTIHQDLVDAYLDDENKDMDLCECFQEGQEFVLDGFQDFTEVPEGFCAWAWADIRKDIVAIATGADMPGLREEGVTITGCTDWFRPVIFKIERIG